MDKATASGERLTFARCFVEVATAETLPCKIMLENDEVRKKYLMLSMSECPHLPKTCVLWPLY